MAQWVRASIMKPEYLVQSWKYWKERSGPHKLFSDLHIHIDDMCMSIHMSACLHTHNMLYIFMYIYIVDSKMARYNHGSSWVHCDSY